jgi:hypothetical protein
MCLDTPTSWRHILCVAACLWLLQSSNHLHFCVSALRHRSFAFVRLKSYSDVFGKRGSGQGRSRCLRSRRRLKPSRRRIRETVVPLMHADERDPRPDPALAPQLFDLSDQFQTAMTRRTQRARRPVLHARTTLLLIAADSLGSARVDWVIMFPLWITAPSLSGFRVDSAEPRKDSKVKSVLPQPELY